jgi:hypothetical protein
MCDITKRLMKESWEAETSTENGEALNPLLISLEETSEGENYSADWPAKLSAVEETPVCPWV